MEARQSPWRLLLSIFSPLPLIWTNPPQWIINLQLHRAPPFPSILPVYNVLCPLTKLLCFALCLLLLYVCHSPPSLCKSITPSMSVLFVFLALIFLLSLPTVCMRLRLSIYIYNAVYVLLPIMLSISVFLLLAGWKGVRGGLSQLIYHIKYQPSSTFYLPLFPPFTRPSLFLLLSLIPFLHLPPFPSLLPVLSTFLLLVCHPPHPPIAVPLSFPHTSPSEPSSTSLKVPISLFLNNCHMPLRLTSCLARNDPRSPSLTFALPFHVRRHALSPYHVRFAEVQYAR